MSSLAAALHELASLVATSPSIRAALIAWHDQVEGPLRPTLEKVSRRALMGAGLVTSLDPLTRITGDDGSLITHAIASGSAHGGSLARTLRSIATSVETRDRLLHEARAATSAGRLSARLLACLGVGSAVLIPAWHRSSLSAIVASTIGAALLGGIGALWMRRLLPRTPGADHPVAACADLIAALVDGGVQLRPACDLVLAPHGHVVGEMARATRRVTLGMAWTDALARATDPDLQRLSRMFGHYDVASGLRALATSLRDERARACEIEARRAPVLLVLPLTLCFLPAFGLIMAVPLLRGLAG